MVPKYKITIMQVFVVISLASNIVSAFKSNIHLSTKKPARYGYYLPNPTKSELKCYENIKSVFQTDKMGDSYRDCIIFAINNLTTKIITEKDNIHAIEYYNFLGKNIVQATKDRQKTLMGNDENRLLTPKEYHNNESSELLEKTHGTTVEDVIKKAYFDELVPDPDTMKGDDVVKFWYAVHIKQCLEINYDEILDPTNFCHKFHSDE